MPCCRNASAERSGAGRDGDGNATTSVNHGSRLALSPAMVAAAIFHQYLSRLMPTMWQWCTRRSTAATVIERVGETCRIPGMAG